MSNEEKEYVVFSKGNVVTKISSNSLDDCKLQLANLGYTIEEIQLFNYKIEGNNGYFAVPFIRNFEVVIGETPLKFWAISIGIAFIEKGQYDELGVNAPIKLKINDIKCVVLDSGIVETVEREQDIYLVLKVLVLSDETKT